MLAIGRGLMSKPRLLMLDEPSLGLSPILTQEVASIIKTISEQEGLTIMLIEQNASIALSLAGKGYVMEIGKVIMEGNAKELQDNEHVRKAYLGIT